MFILENSNIWSVGWMMVVVNPPGWSLLFSPTNIYKHKYSLCLS